MADLEVVFAAHAEIIRNLEKKPTEEEFNELYGLYKQGTLGNNYTAKPDVYDKQNINRWESWNKHRGMSKQDAMRNYIILSKVVMGRKD